MGKSFVVEGKQAYWWLNFCGRGKWTKVWRYPLKMLSVHVNTIHYFVDKWAWLIAILM